MLICKNKPTIKLMKINFGQKVINYLQMFKIYSIIKNVV